MFNDEIKEKPIKNLSYRMFHDSSILFYPLKSEKVLKIYGP